MVGTFPTSSIFFKREITIIISRTSLRSPLNKFVTHTATLALSPTPIKDGDEFSKNALGCKFSSQHRLFVKDKAAVQCLFLAETDALSSISSSNIYFFVSWKGGKIVGTLERPEKARHFNRCTRDLLTFACGFFFQRRNSTFTRLSDADLPSH